MSKELKNMYYYNLSWSGENVGGCMGRFATKEEAQEALKREKENYPYGKYKITKESVADLIAHEREMAVIEERNKIHNEIYKTLSAHFQTELNEAIKKEKKRLQKEMRNIVKNWFEMNPDGNE